jgi:malonyl CoA-acyl carrier protein transacylase
MYDLFKYIDRLKELLNKTEYTQPAILCHSIALWIMIQVREFNHSYLV